MLKTAPHRDLQGDARTGRFAVHHQIFEDITKLPFVHIAEDIKTGANGLAGKGLVFAALPLP